MFCGNCGKEMISNTKFCQFCGAEQTAVVIPAASIPVSEPTDTPDDTASVSISSTPIESSEPIVTSMGISVSDSIPAADESAYAERSDTAPVEIGALPTPNAIPTSNIDVPETAVYTAPIKTEIPARTVPAKTTVSAIPQNEITIKDEEKRPPERKYTLGHIVMCLAAAAVMAVTAGVFAGLYFSVI